MKTSVICILIGLVGGFLASVVIMDVPNNSKKTVSQTAQQSLCYKDYVLNYLLEFMQQQLPEKYLINITGLNSSYELTESPMEFGNNLYDQTKDGVICESDLNIVIKNKEIKTDELKFSLDMRYQILKAVYPEGRISVRISGIDVNKVLEILNNKISEHEQKLAQQIYDNLINPSKTTNETTKLSTQTNSTRKQVVSAKNWGNIKPETQKKYIISVVGDADNIDEIRGCLSTLTQEQADINLREAVDLCNQNSHNRSDEDIDPYIEAKELAEKFEDNTIAFKKKYLGKTLKVQGAVYDFRNNWDSKEYVVLYNGYKDVNCFVNNAEQLINLKKGQHIKAIGTYLDEHNNVNYQINLYDCTIVEE